MKFDDIQTPAAILDYNVLVRNIEYMSEKARENGVVLRPHIKTHKCTNVGELQKKSGVKGITVSTLGEAEHFIDAGFNDVTLAHPMIPANLERVLKLSEKSSLQILVDHPQAVYGISSRITDATLDVIVKVDCGYHRCGVDPESPEAIRIVESIVEAPNLNFEGILTHAGHSYTARNKGELAKIAEQEQNIMVKFAKTLKNESSDLTPNTVSVGSTPTMMISEKFIDGITEIRPGNYVFFDYTQVVLGSCNLEDCALTILSSVIGKYPNRVVIDAGATSLSHDPGPTHIKANSGYGQVIESGRVKLATQTDITSLSQEHGKVALGEESPFIDSEIGQCIQIVPNHSCLTSNLSEFYHVIKDGKVKAKWPIFHGR